MSMEIFHTQNGIECRGYNKEGNGVYRSPKKVKLISFTHDYFSGNDSGDLEAFSQIVKCSNLDTVNPVRNKYGDIVRYRCKAVDNPENRGFCPLAIPPHNQGQKSMEEYVDNLSIINKE